MKKLLILTPIHNEAERLETQVDKVLDWCRKNLSEYDWSYAVLDNASTDHLSSQDLTTRHLALASVDDTYSNFKYYRLQKKGRGHALKWAWKNLEFDYSLYMDIDLAADLDSISNILKGLENGTDLVVGSRWLKESVVKDRKIQRTILSYGYKNLVKLMTGSQLSDFQCGFKAVSSDFIKKIIDKIEDEHWFFDTELILTAEASGYKIKDIPIIWRDDPNSKVRLFKDSWIMFTSLIKFINNK